MSKLRELLSGATPGKWRTVLDGTGVQIGNAGGFAIHKDANPAAHAALIVYLRNNAEAIAALIEAAEKMLTHHGSTARAAEQTGLRAALAAIEK